jgi:hypothetical protein
MVFSDGLMPAAVQDAAVGTAPVSAMNLRTASRAESQLAVTIELSPRGRPNTKVFELCMAGSTRFLDSESSSDRLRLAAVSAARPD